MKHKQDDTATSGYYASVAEKAIKEMRSVLFNEGLNEDEARAVLALIGVNLRTALTSPTTDAPSS